MEKIYAELIRKTLEDVPERLRDAVAALLNGEENGAEGL